MTGFIRKNSKNSKKFKQEEKVKHFDLSFGFVERVAHYEFLSRKDKLNSDGKMQYKKLLDQYESVQANRRKSKMELLPDLELLIKEYRIKKIRQDESIPEPQDPYPYPMSDDDSLPSIPEEITILDNSSDDAFESIEDRSNRRKPIERISRFIDKPQKLTVSVPSTVTNNTINSGVDELLEEFYKSID